MKLPELRRPLTTTFPGDVPTELSSAASETGLTKSAILVEAFILWNCTHEHRLQPIRR